MLILNNATTYIHTIMNHLAVIIFVSGKFRDIMTSLNWHKSLKSISCLLNFTKACWRKEVSFICSTERSVYICISHMLLLFCFQLWPAISLCLLPVGGKKYQQERVRVQDILICIKFTSLIRMWLQERFHTAYVFNFQWISKKN